ncbi:sulfite exporter TauE/SafE family protein [Duganella sp. CF517]|uniref:sulfite exporter TauE/SafE family protein n=1 Tax=Duganella sp. CF517 TaxID=1881038 RepID=UPI000B7E0D69|nr:sulfite exporter TauE/SafE family protein [Duganella sp. CF517]
MTGYQLLPVFLVGLAGSVHCVGMCGGIVGAISASAGKSGPRGLPRNVIPIQRAAGFAGRALAFGAPPAHPPSPARALPRVLAYNAGRIGSYMLAGALAGGLAGGAQDLAQLAGLQLGFYWLANLMLVALGLYLMNAWRGLATLERAGRVLWQRAQPWMAPAMKTLMPADRPHQAFALGALWGWLPCGMVYSVLLTAMLSGSALGGALVMLAFGLGTLPMLTGLGLLGARLRNALQQRKVRIACGLLVLAFGLLGIARAAGVVGGHAVTPAWMDILCLTPHP